MFRRCLTTLALVAAFVPIVRAADEPVLIEQEPRHQLKFDGKEKLAMDRASFKWHKLQQTVKLTNAGNNVFHGVDIRIK